MYSRTQPLYLFLSISLSLTLSLICDAAHRTDCSMPFLALLLEGSCKRSICTNAGMGGCLNNATVCTDHRCTRASQPSMHWRKNGWPHQLHKRCYTISKQLIGSQRLISEVRYNTLKGTRERLLVKWTNILNQEWWGQLVCLSLMPQETCQQWKRADCKEVFLIQTRMQAAVLTT